MRTFFFFLSVLAVVLTIYSTPVESSLPNQSGGRDTRGNIFVPLEYILVFDNGRVPTTSFNTTEVELSDRYKFTVLHRYTDIFRGLAIRLPTILPTIIGGLLNIVLNTVQDLVQLIAQDLRIATIQQVNYVYTAQDAVESIPIATETLLTGETVPTGVKRIQAYYNNYTARAGAPIAVIDTGIQLDHPDMPNVRNGYNCLNPSATGADDHGHGTHVAGTIGAANNGQGVIGVAPGTRMYAVKVLDSAGRGKTSDVICGLEWVAQNALRYGIKIAHMSLGESGREDDGTCGVASHDPLHMAICTLTNIMNVAVVAAAGNHNEDMKTFAPAAYRQVLTVTAISDFDGKAGGLSNSAVTLPGYPSCPYTASDADDTPASYSNYQAPGSGGLNLLGIPILSGSTPIPHITAAPGTCILSTYLNSGYAVMTGTSMSAAHVSGVLALCYLQGESCYNASPSSSMNIILNAMKQHDNARPNYKYTNNNSNKIYGPMLWASAA